MKLDHMVKLNGIYYLAGEEIPEEHKVPEESTDKEPEERTVKRRGRRSE